MNDDSLSGILSDDMRIIILFWLAYFLLQVLILYILFQDRFQGKWFPVCIILYISYNIAFFKMFSVN